MSGITNIYCLDFNTAEKISKINGQYCEWIKEVNGPKSDEELAFIKAAGATQRMCNQLPYKKYKFKVFFNTVEMKKEHKDAFFLWSKNYPALLLPENGKRFLAGDFYSQRPFVYVEDAQTMTIVVMFLGNNAREIQEFIARDSLNTDNKDHLDVSNEHSTTICN